MDAEDFGHDSAGTSSSIAAIAAGTDNSFVANEPACDMPPETIRPTELQPLRPKIQFSTDLRKELSLDVLASLGDSYSDEAKALEDSVLDLTSDMEFISGLSSLSLPPDHGDPAGPNTFLTSSATRPVEPRHLSDTRDETDASEATLLMSSFCKPLNSHSDLPLFNLSSVSSAYPLIGDFLSCVPVNASYSDVFAAVLTSCTASIANPISAVTDAFMDDRFPLSSESTFVFSTHVASAHGGASAGATSTAGELPFDDIQPLTSTSGDEALSSPPLCSPEPCHETFEPRLRAPVAHSALDAAPASLGGSYMSNERLPSFYNGVDVPVSGTLISFASSVPQVSLSSAPASVSILNALASAIRPHSAPLSISVPVADSVLVGSPATFSTPVSLTLPARALTPEAPPASSTPSIDLLTVLADDSLPSPPQPGRFWDVSSSSGPSISSGFSLSSYFDGSRSSFRSRKNARRKKPTETGPDLNDTKGHGISDAEKMEEVAELEIILETQKKMVQWQIDEIQRITALQCQLTGTDPLSEDLVWEVVGVKGGGKKSGDLLSAEALRSLQEIFAIKDTITKKEAREISVTSGASLTQVREFFAAQRSLVRKLVQQAHDEAGRLGIKNAFEQSQQIAVLNTVAEVEMDLGFDKLTGVDSMEKLIELMRVEKGFAGQAQLLQVILRTDSTSLILRRFLEKGGLKVLGGWLVEAAGEDQTSVVCQLLKVLDHLPMSYAVANQMPSLVQNVNKLRFYNVLDVAGQARSLLTKWSKMFLPKTEVVKTASSPGRKLTSENETSPGISSGVPKRIRDPSASQAAPGLRKKKVKAEDVFQHEVKSSPAATPVSPSLNGPIQGVAENPSSSQPAVLVPPSSKPRWSSTLQPSESAVAAVSVSRKRLASKSLGDLSKDRRKVLLVEDNHVGKNALPGGGSKPAVISKNSRPLSTDDIYKAKKLERLMQEPVAKSRRRSVVTQELPETQDMVSPSGRPPKNSSPVVPVHVSGAKKGASWIQSPDQRNVRRDSTGGPVQEDLETLNSTYLSTRMQKQFERKRTITPTSSQELFPTTITPTSSQELSIPAAGDISEDTAHKSDSVSSLRMDTGTFFSSLLASPTREFPGSVVRGGAQAPTELAGLDVANLTVSNSVMSNEPRDGIPFLQEPISKVLERKEALKSFAKLAVVEDIGKPIALREHPSRLDELSGLSVLPGVVNLVEKSAKDVTRSKDERCRVQQPETGSSMIKDTTLLDFYATLRASMIRWRIPPEFQPDVQWNVAAGEDSKEKEFQSVRVKREEEAYYAEASSIPDDPKNPWEEEPSYDDSLTLEIFIDSGLRKVSAGMGNQSFMAKSLILNAVPTGMKPSSVPEAMTNSKQNSTARHGQELAPNLLRKGSNVNGLDLVLQRLSATGDGTHDPDLLALLLRNPELVSQLTSGQAFSSSGIANQSVFMQPLDPLKQTGSSGTLGVGLSTQAGDLGQDRFTSSNSSNALGIPLQPGRSVSSVDQTQSETLRVQDSISMMPHPGMGQQQTLGAVPQGGVDSRFSTSQMTPTIVRNIHDSSGWEQPRVPPLPPPLPPMQTVTSQVLQPLLQSQPNKPSNWAESQGWVGIGRPPMNPPQTHLGQEQLHARLQTGMSHNVRPASYGGVVGVAQVEVSSGSSVIPQQEMHQSQRSWPNGSHIVSPIQESAMMQVAQDAAGRNSRWPRPPARPLEHHSRSGGNREFPEFNGRQSNVVESRPVWVPNDRSRPGLPQFQGGYGLPPPPQFPPAHAPHWQGQEGNIRPGQGGAVPPAPLGRDLRPPQQQLWHNSMGNSRQLWR